MNALLKSTTVYGTIFGVAVIAVLENHCGPWTVQQSTAIQAGAMLLWKVFLEPLSLWLYKQASQPKNPKVL